VSEFRADMEFHRQKVQEWQRLRRRLRYQWPLIALMWAACVLSIFRPGLFWVWVVTAVVNVGFLGCVWVQGLILSRQERAHDCEVTS
jgi:hypothetical protein